MNVKIETERLLLRCFSPEDAPRVAEICNNEKLHRGTYLPYPYTLANAEEWLARRAEEFANRESYVFAIVEKASGSLIGCIGAQHNAARQNACMGYWIGEPFWGQGYATEAANAFVQWLFTLDDVHKVCANHFGYNTASGRVMQKIGMTYEGTQREQVYRDGVYHDLVHYGKVKPKNMN